MNDWIAVTVASIIGIMYLLFTYTPMDSFTRLDVVNGVVDSPKPLPDSLIIPSVQPRSIVVDQKYDPYNNLLKEDLELVEQTSHWIN